MCGSLKKTEPPLSALWPSFNGREKSIRITRRKENPRRNQDQVGANPFLISDSEVTIQALPCLCRAANEVNSVATVIIMEDSMRTILQEGLVAHQIMQPLEDLHLEPTGPQLGHIMTMDNLRDRDNKVHPMGHTIQGHREGTMTMDLLKDTEDQTKHMGLMIQGHQ